MCDHDEMFRCPSHDKLAVAKAVVKKEAPMLRKAAAGLKTPIKIQAPSWPGSFYRLLRYGDSMEHSSGPADAYTRC